VTRNYRALLKAAPQYPSVDVLPSEGGWYAVIQVPAMQSEESLVVQLLERTASSCTRATSSTSRGRHFSYSASSRVRRFLTAP